MFLEREEDEDQDNVEQLEELLCDFEERFSSHDNLFPPIDGIL